MKWCGIGFFEEMDEESRVGDFMLFEDSVGEIKAEAVEGGGTGLRGWLGGREEEEEVELQKELFESPKRGRAGPEDPDRFGEKAWSLLVDPPRL